MTHGAGNAATRPASPDEIKRIETKLGDLRKNYGVWRDGLAGFLGQELCDRLHVVTKAQPGRPRADSTDEVRAKVIWHLRRLVAGVLTDEENRRSAAIAFNITSYPELRKLRTIGDRVKWGYERDLCLSRERVDDRTIKVVIPELARELGKIQPVPSREGIEAIIIEFHAGSGSAERATPSAEQSLSSMVGQDAIDADPSDESGASETQVDAQINASIRRARWTSPTAYNDLDLDSFEGVRAMYRLMMAEVAEAVYDEEMSVSEVVSILGSNTQRPDISGYDSAEMAEQIELSTHRLWQIFEGQVGPGGIQGRVIDENGQVVDGLQQATGVRFDIDGQVVAASLISDSEVDAWMRGVLEYTPPEQIVTARTEAVRVLSSHMRRRLQRAISAEQQAEEYAIQQAENFGGNSAQAVEGQYALLRSEREAKRQLATIDAYREAMRRASPENVRYMTENVFEHDINMGAAGWMNIRRLIERFCDDEEFKQYRG